MYRISSEVDREKMHSDFEGYGGIYKLHCLQEKENGFVAVNRILGTDVQGVLYIGRTGPGLDRIGDLIKALSPNYKSRGHHAGLRYRKNQKLQESVPFERLCVTFTPADDPVEAEREGIQSYFQQFGEVPPLNANEP